MYKYVLNFGKTVPQNDCIMRVSDGAIIPFDPANRDYQEYQKWIVAGNVPLPASPQP